MLKLPKLNKVRIAYLGAALVVAAVPIYLFFHLLKTPLKPAPPRLIQVGTSARSTPTPTTKPSTIDASLLKSYTPRVVNGLITNEYAFYNQNDPSSVKSPDWQMTSGSLFAKDGVFWSGVPDSCDSGPNALSTNCTHSDVFRLNSAASFGGNVKVSFSLMQLQDIHSSNCNTNDTCWHGTHIWLRYQSQFNLYYASVNRADGDVVLKRKVPCGSDNSGTYIVLGNYVKHNYATGSWNSYSVTIQTNTDGSVTLKLYDDNVNSNVPVVTGTDNGGTNPNWTTSCKTSGAYPSAHYQPITASGGVGVRGDFANFEFKDFTVRSF